MASQTRHRAIINRSDVQMQDESCETDLLSRVAHGGRHAYPSLGDGEDTQTNRRNRMRDLEARSQTGRCAGMMSFGLR